MESLMKKAKDANTNNKIRSRPDIGCKKHPKHKQSAGVCSICLSQKLHQLAKTGSRTNSSKTSTHHRYSYGYSSNDSSSSLSSYYSSSGSSSSSPMYCYKYEAKTSNDTRNTTSLSFLLLNGKNKNVITKSKSLAFVPRVNGNVQDHKSGQSCEKKSGIWSKLLKPSRGKRSMEKGLEYSMTMRGSVVVNE